MIEGGFVLVARKMIESEYFVDKPPLSAKLWLWMLMKANFKDRDKLQRGQFITTIDEMREAMSYKIGYRKVTPTRDQLRKSYEGFTKAHMTTTTKTTRGMIVTILNYNYYQNPKNYEDHNEDSTKTQRRPNEATHDTEECKNEKNGIRDNIYSSKSDPEKSYRTKKGKLLKGLKLTDFELFWGAFDYKSGKAEAADAWLNIKGYSKELVEKITKAAKAEADRRKEIIAQGLTPKMAQGWITSRRWEDEIDENGGTKKPWHI